MFEAGKPANFSKEMERFRLDILGLIEIRWVDSGKLYTNHKVLYYSGNNDSDHSNGVRALLSDEIYKTVVNFLLLSDRCLIQLTRSPFNINIIQRYASTADKSEQELEKWYHDWVTLMKITK